MTDINKGSDQPPLGSMDFGEQSEPSALELGSRFSSRTA